jgi:hypothetical protein
MICQKVGEEKQMKKPRVSTYPGDYKGCYWAIVLGPKHPHLVPRPLSQFVRTINRAEALDVQRIRFPRCVVRAIPQPIPPEFEAGM